MSGEVSEVLIVFHSNIFDLFHKWNVLLSDKTLNIVVLPKRLQPNPGCPSPSLDCKASSGRKFLPPLSILHLVSAYHGYTFVINWLIERHILLLKLYTLFAILGLRSLTSFCLN